jgi:hypothetical protein
LADVLFACDFPQVLDKITILHFRPLDSLDGM